MAFWSPTDHSEAVLITDPSATRNPAIGAAYQSARSDLQQSSGIATVTFTITDAGSDEGSGPGMMVGVGNGAASLGAYVGSDANGCSYRTSGSILRNAGGIAFTAYTTGDVIGMVVDFAAKTVKFNKNGGSYSPTTDITSLGDDLFATCSLGNGATPPIVSASGSWGSVVTSPTLNIVEHGDSISLTGAVRQTYLPRLASLIRTQGLGVASWTRCGINGASWAYAWPNAGYPWTLTEDLPLRVTPAKSVTLPNWLIVFAGTNGITLAVHSAATEYNDFKTYITAALAAGWKASQIIVCTMLPRTGVSEATRGTYNASLVSGAATYGYKVARLDLNPDIGVAGQNLNTTWFLDGTHPTDAGHQVIAGIICPLLGLSAGGGGMMILGNQPRTAEDIRKARARFGLVVDEVAEVVEKVAQAEVKKAKPSPTRSLRREFERKQLEWHETYAQALRDEIKRLRQERDDEEIAAVLLLM